MSYGDQRRKFTVMVAKLILFAIGLGYEVALDDGKCRTGHRKDSFHYKALAQDINLYKDGVYLDKTEDHQPLGNYWESLDPKATWGGRWNDGNHYSLGEGR